MGVLMGSVLRLSLRGWMVFWDTKNHDIAEIFSKKRIYKGFLYTSRALSVV